ncbi:MAG: dihydroorotate dehydrogenase electron transfer subunit [Clostridia bacterium]|nr:dihydroorotate dehydrogenase electron transfer subunit [Clostridia bacterium]
MKKYDVKNCKIVRADELVADNIYDFEIFYPEFAQAAKPGQFAHIYIPGRTLRRPISICDINKEKGTLRLVFQIRGAGTAQLAEFTENQFLDVLAPLGNGFKLEDANKKAVFVGGGIGVPPLLSAAKFYGKNATVALGFRNKDAVILEDDFKACGADVRIATDDGSYGHHGLVIDLIKDEKPDIIYACGPTPMLKAVAAFAEENGIECQISLEERMACGIGACLGCAVKLRDDEGNEYNGHVCKDGPVFDHRKVVY